LALFVPYLLIGCFDKENKMNLEDLPLRVKHLIRYMNSIVPKDKKTMADKYPVEMTKTHKDYITAHLQHIHDTLVKEIK